MMGDGATEASKLLGLLGLPRDTSMESGTFKNMEERLAPFIEQLKDSIILENIIQEVKLTGQLSEDDFNWWVRSIQPGYEGMAFPPALYPKIKAGFDAAWQQAGSQHTCDSPSGHGTLFGAGTGKCLGIGIKSKLCNWCHHCMRRNPLR